MTRPPARRTRLTVQSLEGRETPAAGPWSVESFDGSPFPVDWSRGPTASSVRVMAGVGLDATPALVLPGGPSAVRVWEQAVLPADFGARATVRADGAVPVQVLVRGHHLGTTRPTYYAASLGSGGTVELVRMVAGSRKVLATVRATEWTAGQWIDVTIQPTGTRVAVALRRADSGQFLNAVGRWQGSPAFAVVATDAAIAEGGQAGIIRPPAGSGRVRVDNFTAIAPDLPAEGSFDGVTLGALPSGWDSWRSDPAGGFRTAAAGMTGNALASTGDSRQADRAWPTAQLPADTTVTAAIRVESLVPAEVLVRGQRLGEARPTYYAVRIVRGTEVRLLRVVDGSVSELGRVTSADYVSGAWLDVSLTAQGDRLQVRVRRPDTGDWLNRFGEWQAGPAAALDATDTAIRQSGRAGVGRAAGVAGTVLFDNVRVGPAAGDVTPPAATARVQARTPAARPGTVRGVARFLATARDAAGVARVEYLVDGEPVVRQAAPPYRYDFETRNLSNGRRTLSVRAWDSAGNLTEVSRPFVVDNPPVERPVLPRHYSHIRVAALAYNGVPMGPVEQRLLRDSIDLVVPNARYLSAIDQASPKTPQVVYSNVSNLYLDLLTDWLAYADRHRLPRESAFYHVARPTAFAGDSPSSQPVNWFWNIARGPLQGTTGFASATVEARRGKPGGVAFGAGAVYVGYPDRFREINVTLTRPATADWSGVLEYPTAVDAAGRPTVWQAASVLADSTNGLRGAGRVTFHPPKDWQPAVVPGSAARLLYVRIRAASGDAADAPVAASILGRDYVGANDGKAGTIAAFDGAADADGDGYLSDAEYAARRPGADARFAYESRLFYPYYGQMRFITNPSGPGVAAWAADYHRRLLATQPLADGVFMDNSAGRLPSDTPAAVESTDTYALDYAAVLGAVNRAIAPRWVLANTSGGGTTADRVARQVPATIEEFALRPLAQSWGQFQELAGTVTRRLSAGYLILDSLSTGGSPTDPRTRMAALASYYLLADPEATLFMAWGGEEPASAWSRHWWDAIGFDIGRPVGTWSEFASGTDSANTSLTFRVFQRSYERALVLYKPLSYAAGKGTGGTGEGTVTIHRLTSNYRLLNADGSLGPVTRLVSLRSGEGAILVKA